MLRLLRWMFPYMLLVCLAAAFMGMLNARGHFFIPAMGATMLNVVMIASVLWLAPHWGHAHVLHEQIFALAVGVLVAGFAQATFQLPTLFRDGFRYHWVSPWKNPTVRLVVRRMVPGAIGVAAFQINVVIIQGLGLWLDKPTAPLIAPFNYAVRLMELPQGVFGISLATFLLPTLAGLAAEKKYDEFRSTLRQGMAHLLLINGLMAVLLITLAEPIIRLLFERGRFDAESTARAAFALECLGASLVAYSLVNVLARAFFALGDTRTPMKISIVCLAINLIAALGLVWPLRQGGLGLANTISSAFNLGFLLYALRRKLAKLEMAPLQAALPAIAAAAVVAAVSAWGVNHLWDAQIGHSTLWRKLGAVFVPGGIACIAYWMIALYTQVPAAHEITTFVFRKFRGRA